MLANIIKLMNQLLLVTMQDNAVKAKDLGAMVVQLLLVRMPVIAIKNFMRLLLVLVLVIAAKDSVQ